MAWLMAGGLELSVLCAVPALGDTLRGVAHVRERIALPDGLLFEAVFEECHSGVHCPVVPEGDYMAPERA